MRLILKIFAKIKKIFKSKKKKSILKPMGIRSTVYPDGYIPPIKRVLSDGTVEYYIPVKAQLKLIEAWKKMGKESIVGKSLNKHIIISDPGDECEPIMKFI
ncbi:MAG: hypothetical protein QXL18_05490 [Candidatus Woesearchaeota archaeon]